MILRNIEKQINEWIKNGKDAFLLTGARQIGKTYLIRECLKKSGHKFAEINFIERKELIPIFESANGREDVLLRLSGVINERLVKGDTIIFFDEVQECKELVTQIKFLVEEGSFRYILSGSLLGIELNDIRSQPVGYMRIVDMFPLNIQEFCTALGLRVEVFEQLEKNYAARKPVDTIIHKRLIDMIYLYSIVGGMPEAVKAYLETNDLKQVEDVQKKIIRLYKQDFTKYEKKQNLRLKEVYDAVPSELNEKNKRFFINHLGTGELYKKTENDFLWLKDAGVVLPVYNVLEPRVPLKISEKRSLFKLFLSDVGLLTCQYPAEVRLRLLRQDKDINNGALFENIAAQELIAKGYSLYYFNSKKQGEIDFLIERGDSVLPIEIKSGKDYKKHSALDNLLSEEQYHIDEAYIFSNSNIEIRDKKCYLPIYMLMFLQEPSLNSVIYKLDLSSL